MNAAGAVVGLGASAMVLAIAFAASSGDEPSKLDEKQTCAVELSASGSFVVPDDTGRCALSYPPGARLRCGLTPIVDIAYQWSWLETTDGLTTIGLRRGATVAFECTEGP